MFVLFVNVPTLNKTFEFDFDSYNKSFSETGSPSHG